MDSLTHMLTGYSLGQFLQQVAKDIGVTNINTLKGIAIAAFVGSLVPDLDSVIRTKGFEYYLKYHRSWSHAWPMWPILATAITWMILFFQSNASFWPIWLASMLGIGMHVGLDILNNYGTKWLLPFSQKWIHADVLPIFDPILFAMHLSGVIITFIDPSTNGWCWHLIYCSMTLWILYRISWRIRVKKRIRARFGLQSEGIKLAPKFWPWQWQYEVQTENHLLLGELNGKKIRLFHRLPAEQPINELVEKASNLDGVRTFLGFAQRVHTTIHQLTDGCMISLRDRRFRYKRKMPFGINLYFDVAGNMIRSELGWHKKWWEPPFV